MSDSMSKAHVQKTFFKITTVYSGHCKLLTRRALSILSLRGLFTAAPQSTLGFCLFSGSLVLTCVWPLACRMPLGHTSTWSIFTFLWGRDLAATFLGKPGLCQGNIKMVGQNRMFLKTF